MEESLYEWLDRIETRPSMYLPTASFCSLESFVAGYETALLAHRIGEVTEPPFASFGRFVAQRLGHHVTDADSDFGGPSWRHCIVAATRGDQDAFYLFFKLLREFRGQGPPE